MTLIWFTHAPNPALMFAVQRAGHLCVQAGTEALVRAIMQQYPDSVVIVGHDILQAQAREVQQNYMTIHLTAQATVRDLIFELSHLYGARPEKVQ